MKQKFLLTVIVCLAVLVVAAVATGYLTPKQETSVTRVGFVYSEDESTPYTANFVRAQRALEEEYGDQIIVYTRSNVLNRDAEEPMRELIREGAGIIFINMDTDIPVTLAREFPEVQFCQVSLPTITMEGTPENYHTFNGEIYQARYVSGIAAGLKLRQLLDSGELASPEAAVGFVGANDSTEVLSGLTAFLLGVRSVVPEATMRVRFTGSWSNYARDCRVSNRDFNAPGYGSINDGFRLVLPQ